MLEVLGQIDQNDSVFLDDAAERMNADDRNQAEIVMNRISSSSAPTRRWQGQMIVMIGWIGSRYSTQG